MRLTVLATQGISLLPTHADRLAFLITRSAHYVKPRDDAVATHGPDRTHTVSSLSTAPTTPVLTASSVYRLTR